MDSSYSEKISTVEDVAQGVQERSVSELDCSQKINPRALVFKASEKDLKKIKELIETKFANVEIIYVTTGPAASILHVTKSMPFEAQNASTQPFHTIE